MIVAGIGVDQDDPVAFRLQRLYGLGAGVIEFTGLADNDRAGADDEDGLDVCPLGHELKDARNLAGFLHEQWRLQQAERVLTRRHN